MKSLRLFKAVFEGELPPDQLRGFRGAIVEKVGKEHHAFHNHDQKGWIYRYPMIQYKRVKKHPCILGVGSGVEEAQRLFLQKDWELWINGQHYPLRINSFNIDQFELGVYPERRFSYRLRDWLPLNQKNHEKYRNLKGLKERVSFLERILVGNILSFARGVDWEVDQRIEVEIDRIHKERSVPFKGTSLKGFDLSFRTNVFLPHRLGLGKGASIGHGVITGDKNQGPLKGKKKTREERAPR